MAYSGPFITERTTGYNLRYVKYAYRQSGPWVAPLPYLIRKTTGFGVGDGFWATTFMSNLLSRDESYLSARCYDRFQKQLGERASLALTLLDLPKSIQMIAGRSRQLIRAVHAVKRGNLVDAVYQLGQDPKHHRRKLKHLQSKVLNKPQDAWLELSFGWKPLLNDIHSSVNVMQQEFGFTSVKATATDVYYETSNDPNIVFGGQAIKKISWGARVRIDNPNLFLANQLGLVNPAYVLWDAIPFSFVIDWFVPVSTFLSSFTNEFGLSLEQSYTTRRMRIPRYAFYTRSGDHGFDGHGTWDSFERELRRLPRPNLLTRTRIPNLSPWLAATSVSLLMQQLSSLRK